MSPVHLHPPKPAKHSTAFTLRQYAQLSFLQNVRADWLVPLVAIIGLGYLVYFVTTSLN